MILERFISLFGLFVMIGLAWLMSSHKRRISWRIVIGGLLLQFVLAVIVIHTPPGKWLLDGTKVAFDQLMGFVDHGAGFVFGDEATESGFAANPPVSN